MHVSIQFYMESKAVIFENEREEPWKILQKLIQ